MERKNNRTSKRVSYGFFNRDDPHGKLGGLKGYGLAPPTQDIKLNRPTKATHCLSRTAPLLLPGNLYPKSPPEICYGTEFVVTASAV